MPGIDAVVLDWAGTTVDYGSRAPVDAFRAVFGRFGLTLTEEEIRGPMGLAKREHVRELLRIPHVAAHWKALYGSAPDEAAVEHIHQAFLPATRAMVRRNAELIPGTAQVMTSLRRQGIALGSTTGYTRDIIEEIRPVAAAGGFAPDAVVCAGETGEGRPGPSMVNRCLEMLGVERPDACLKVDDSVPGVQEGLAAGCWTAGISLTGTGVGLSRETVQALPPDRRAELNDHARDLLRTAGAHYVIDSIADLMGCIADIRARAPRAEAPVGGPGGSA